MATEVRERHDIPTEYTWDLESVFADPQAWDLEYSRIEQSLPGLDRFQGHLADDAQTLSEWIETGAALFLEVYRLYVYASMAHTVDTADQTARARYDRALSLVSRVTAATAFGEPEIIAIGEDRIQTWEGDDTRLTTFRHYLDELFRRQEHVRSSEVEEILGLAQDPFSIASGIHSVLTDTDLRFQPARSADGNDIDLQQGNLLGLLSSTDRDVRRTAWENYSDAHLSVSNTMAACLTAGVKQDVFFARARRYPSSLEAALGPNFIPVEVFRNLIDTFERNLPTWHRYWRVRRAALGYEQLCPWDIFAPLTSNPPRVQYAQSIEWISEGLRPLGTEYIDALRRGATTERWVDIFPNLNKTSGAYSSGVQGTHPFILMSYNDDIFSLSTLAHELGHSMHSYLAWRTQPAVYSGYGLFVAEVASNFNQAMVRAHLMATIPDRDFQITLIEEALANFHRYFFVMPTLARFELEIHERAEKGAGFTAEMLTSLCAGLFGEAYGQDVSFDRDRVGITWAQFSSHLYANFYVYQYATGISAANALAQDVLTEGQPAADRYLRFLSAGGSLYPLEALEIAGIDMRSPAPVQAAFDVLAGLIDRLEALTSESP